MADEYSNLITFDFVGLQSLLKNKFALLNKQVAEVKLGLLTLQEQQEKRSNWENIVLEKMNALEKSILGVASQESVAKLQGEVTRFKNTFADEMVGVHTTVVGMREELSNVNTEFIKLVYDTNESKTTMQRSVNDVSTRLQNSDQKQAQICQILEDNINNTKNLKARCDELQSSLSVAAMRADRTDKLISSEVQTFAAFRDQHNASTRQFEDRIANLSDDITAMKVVLDESSQMRRTVANLSQEVAKLNANVKEIEKTGGGASGGLSPMPSLTSVRSGEFSSINSANVATGANGANGTNGSGTPSSPEISTKYLEQHKLHNDLRRDVSDMGMLMEAITSEMNKLKDTTPNQDSEWLKILQSHSKQLSNLLQTKADVSMIETLLMQDRTKLSPEEKEELANLRELIQSKANKKDLVRIKKKLEQGLYAVQPQQDKPSMDAAITRVQLRCLSCDRLINPPEGEGILSPYFDLSPNIALRRSRVREMLKDARANPSLSPSTSTNSLASTSGSLSRRILTPVIATPRRPVSAPSKDPNIKG